MKKFKILFMTILLISVLALSTMLCSCDTSDGSTKLTPIVRQNYDNVVVSIYRDGRLTLKNPECSAIIKSVEELNAFCDVDTSSIFAKENIFSNGENQRIINVLKERDKTFFKNKSLVVLFRERGSSGYLYDFNDYNIDGAELNITLTMATPKEPVAYPCDMATFIYVFEFDKSKVTGVTQVNVQEIERQKDFDFKYYSCGIGNNYATIIKTIEDLSVLFTDENSPMFAKEEYNENRNVKNRELLKEYDEEFFQDKSLVVIFRFRSVLGLKSEIKYCDIVGNTMNVTVAKISEANAGYATAIEMHICLLEFGKAKVESVTQINVREINEVLPSKDLNA